MSFPEWEQFQRDVRWRSAGEIEARLRLMKKFDDVLRNDPFAAAHLHGFLNGTFASFEEMLISCVAAMAERHSRYVDVLAKEGILVPMSPIRFVQRGGSGT